MRKLIAVFLFISFYGFGQTDFNNYTSILSKGEIPEDFATLTYEKLKSDLDEANLKLSSKLQKDFFESINYAIDDILHSGYVVYGDEISTYIENIADRLLRNDHELRAKLRFYTIKSNSANAFSTEQGIVFVTTGLISHVTSEAELAYILAHEISHFTEHHVLESFTYRLKNRRQSIEQMSVYSKDKEFEADREGLRLYHAAGYDSNDVMSVLDVLMYSYLPFEEVEMTLDYFMHSDSLFLPSHLLPQEQFEIKADEDQDDSKSSHPNIRKRKEAIQETIDDLDDWGNNIYPLGEERFTTIRNMARFESVRNDIIEANYADAIYSIFLLESEFEESIYLQRMKAQSWLGTLMYLLDHKLSRTVDEKSDYEGESAAIHYLIKELSRDELEAMCLRQIFDIYNEYSTDEEVKLIWDKALKTIVWGENFKSDDYSNLNFYEAIDQDLSPDTSEFHHYLIPDVLRTDAFKLSYTSHKLEFESIQAENDIYNSLTYRQQKKVDEQESEDQLKLGINDLIIMEPIVQSYYLNELNPVKSEKLSAQFSEAIEETSEFIDMNTQIINSEQIKNEGTTAFNDRMILQNCLYQLATNEDIDPFPVDYQHLQLLKEKKGTSKVMFSYVENKSGLTFTIHDLIGIILYPIAPIYFPIKFITTNTTEVHVLILDINNTQIITGSSKLIKCKARKHTIGAYVFDVFQQLKSLPQ